MTLPVAAAVALFVGVLAYSVLGGADFGSGFFDLTAGARAGARRCAGWSTTASGRCGRPTTSG